MFYKRRIFDIYVTPYIFFTCKHYRQQMTSKFQTFLDRGYAHHSVVDCISAATLIFLQFSLLSTKRVRQISDLPYTVILKTYVRELMFTLENISRSRLRRVKLLKEIYKRDKMNFHANMWRQRSNCTNKLEFSIMPGWLLSYIFCEKC